MRLKEVNKCGIFCWSPVRNEPFIAIANTNQQFDNNFGSSQSKLDVFDLCLNDSAENINVHCSLETGNNSFTGMCWHKNNLLFLGTKTAKIQAFRVLNATIKNEFEVGVKAEHQSINCLDLNENEDNLICSGSNDGSITIWDINESLKPCSTLSPTIPSANDEVISVVWNKQVKSIIASVTNSNVYIYDTRKKEQTTPIMQVSDCNATSVWGPGAASITYPKSVCWSNKHSTTLIVASANDANPHLQLWDLRYANCPLRYLKGGHNRGIVTVAWNAYDEEIILSAAKDNTTCLWNAAVGQNDNPLISVIPSISNQWINDIKWCPWEPSLFTVGSLDGRTTIYNITQNNLAYPEATNALNSFNGDSPFIQPYQYQTGHPSMQPHIILPFAPKWLRKPFGVSWAFGGKLIRGAPTTTENETEAKKRSLVIEQVVNDVHFVSRADKIDNAINNDNLLEFCKFKTNEYYSCKNEALGLAWRLVETHFYNHRLKVQELLMLLGYPSVTELSSSMSNLEICDQNSNQSPVTNKTLSPSNNSYDDYDDRQTGNTTTNTSPEMQYSKIFSPSFLQNQKPITIETSSENDKLLGNVINNCLLTGQYKKAVEHCIANNSWTEALLLSWFVENESFSNTLKQYFSHIASSNSSNYSSLLWCLISGRIPFGDSDKCDITVLQQLAMNVDLKYWRETIVFILRESNSSNMKLTIKLIDCLAERLLVQQQVDSNSAWVVPALYCYILSGNYENISKYCQNICGGFLNTIELVLVLKNIVPTKTETPVANELLIRYAEILASEGKLEDAYRYLKDAPDSELKYRLSTHIQQKNFRKDFGRPTQQQYSTGHGYRNTMQPYVNPNYTSLPPTSVNRAPIAPAMGAVRHPPSVRPPPITRQPNPSISAVEPVKRFNNPGYPPPQSYQQANYGYTQPNVHYPQPTPTPPPPPTTPLPISNRQMERQVMEQRQNYPSGWNDPPPMPTMLPAQPKRNLGAPNPMPIFQPPDPVQDVVNQHPPPSQSRRSSISRRSLSTPPPPVELSFENQQLFSQYEALLQQIQHQLEIQSQLSLNMRRKLDDIRLKLENLRLKLSKEGQLSVVTLTGLKDIVAAINANDYNTASSLHSHLVASTTFGETADFLPAIKVLVHLAHQHIH